MAGSGIHVQRTIETCDADHRPNQTLEVTQRHIRIGRIHQLLEKFGRERWSLARLRKLVQNFENPFRLPESHSLQDVPRLTLTGHQLSGKLSCGLFQLTKGYVHIASVPVSPVRILMASSTGITNTFPSPTSPVCAALRIASMARSSASSATTSSILSLGRKST